MLLSAVMERPLVSGQTKQEYVRLERIYALANPRHSPAPAPPDAPPTPAAPVPRRVRPCLSIRPNPSLGRPARSVTSKTAR